VWDWGWADEWVDGIISRLPGDACLMSVSEWGIPIGHGGVETTVGEYSISVIGPGQRALRRWELARKRGLEAVAKIQAGNTWELSAVPYIPAVANVARHAANLSLAGVNRLMLGWTLGGYPSPNLEVVAQVAALDSPGQSPRSGREAGWSAEVLADKAMIEVAERRYGARLKDAVVSAWKLCGAAFSEFPFHGGLVYNAPMQFGPSNPLWAEPTGYGATMVGFPYDDLDGWRQVYPSEVFIGQFDVVADGFDQAVKQLNRAAAAVRTTLDARHRQAIDEELMVMEAASIHFRSTANQARFVVARRALAQANTSEEAHTPIASLESVLRHELSLARRLCAIQSRDSRIGFEASNQYFYVPLDLAEKAINCRDLLDRWLPAERAKRAASK
jgi:hypothetical protein